MGSIPHQPNNRQSPLPLVVAIVGPTASGKTAWGVQLAKKFNGEIISADSRQVYRGMDIGTGKDKSAYGRVKVHGLDLVSPQRQYTVAAYQRYVYRVIKNIVRRGKLPIIVGGTGLYINAVVHGYQFNDQTDTQKLVTVRAQLEKWPLNKLLTKLKKIDLPTYVKIDQQNRRRVQRALEIYLVSGRTKSASDARQPPPYRFCLIGIDVPKAELHHRIHRRLLERVEKESMIGEVERLHQAGVSWTKLESFGLEYRWISRFLRGQIDFETMLTELEHDIQQFAKRQLTWWRREHMINWVRTYRQVETVVKHQVFKQ